MNIATMKIFVSKKETKSHLKWTRVHHSTEDSIIITRLRRRIFSEFTWSYRDLERIATHMPGLDGTKKLSKRLVTTPNRLILLRGVPKPTNYATHHSEGTQTTCAREHERSQDYQVRDPNRIHDTTNSNRLRIIKHCAKALRTKHIL